MRGESLFNDGVGIVVFGATIGLATGDASHITTQEVIERFLLEACGGAALGVLTGFVVMLLVRKVHDHDVDFLASPALATGTYGLAHALHMSGPIALVVAGMSMATEFGLSSIRSDSRTALRGFWSLTDEALNVLLFLLIGLEILEVSPGPPDGCRSDLGWIAWWHFGGAGAQSACGTVAGYAFAALLQGRGVYDYRAGADDGSGGKAALCVRPA